MGAGVTINPEDVVPIKQTGGPFSPGATARLTRVVTPGSHREGPRSWDRLYHRKQHGQRRAPRPHFKKRSNQNAYRLFMDILDSYGFKRNKHIARVVRNAIQNGVTDPTQLQAMVQDTREWRERFKGNELRRKRGLNVLSVQDYLSLENQYASIIHNAGLPRRFANDKEDFAQWIGKDVSPAELQDRVSLAQQAVRAENPNVRQQLARMGIKGHDLLAYFLNPRRALPILQEKYQAALIGAAAHGTQFGDISTHYARTLAERGVTRQQALEGFSQANDLLNTFGDLGDIYGVDYNKNTALHDVFAGSADSEEKRRKLTSLEEAAFAGESGVGRLAEDTAGEF